MAMQIIVKLQDREGSGWQSSNLAEGPHGTAVVHVDKEARAKIANSLVLHLPDASKMLFGDVGQKPYRQAGQSYRSAMSILYTWLGLHTKAVISHLYAALFCGSLTSISLHDWILFRAHEWIKSLSLLHSCLEMSKRLRVCYLPSSLPYSRKRCAPYPGKVSQNLSTFTCMHSGF